MDFEMNTLSGAISLPVGLLILLKGADWLVDGAVSLAEKFGVSPMVIGLTVVAMGTSAPEAAASIAAALRNAGDVAIGNVYGSNIANLAFIGGVCAIIRPITVNPSVVRREMPLMLLYGLLLWPVLANSYLGRDESIMLLVLFTGLIAFTVYAGLRDAKTESIEVAEVREHLHGGISKTKRPLYTSIILVLLGLGGLALGADIAIRAAVLIGAKAGLSKAVIGLSIIAVGTSLPELMTCVVAAFKGHDDISIGNLVGSNVFNTLLVVGLAGTIRSFKVSGRLTGTDYWIMIVVSATFLLMATVSKRIGRTYGAVLVAGYVAYMLYLLALTRGFA
jgi:cation:H+ antiporter